MKYLVLINLNFLSQRLWLTFTIRLESFQYFLWIQKCIGFSAHIPFISVKIWVIKSASAPYFTKVLMFRTLFWSSLCDLLNKRKTICFRWDPSLGNVDLLSKKFALWPHLTSKFMNSKMVLGSENFMLQVFNVMLRPFVFSSSRSNWFELSFPRRFSIVLLDSFWSFKRAALSYSTLHTSPFLATFCFLVRFDMKKFVKVEILCGFEHRLGYIVDIFY